MFGAFPRLTDEQIETLARYGQRRPVRPGQVLLAEGEPSTEFFVVLAGKVAVVEGHGTAEERIVRVARAAAVPRRDERAHPAGRVLQHGGTRAG